MKNLALLIGLLLILSVSCINQGAKRLEQEQKLKAEQDSITIFEKPFQDDPSKIEYRIPILKGTKLRHGVQERYYRHGSVYSKIPYTKNIRHGIAYTFYKAYNDDEPKIWKKQPYVNGKLEGTCCRFYKSGKLQAEYEYNKGLPAVGLKEYKESGELINQPYLKVNSSPTDRYYYITAELSKPKSKVTFYTGELVDGKYMPANMKKLQERDGVAELLIPKDAVKKKTATVVAVFYTRLNNKCILAKTVNLN